jgi:hypothetical protein
MNQKKLVNLLNKKLEKINEKMKDVDDIYTCTQRIPILSMFKIKVRCYFKFVMQRSYFKYKFVIEADDIYFDNEDRDNYILYNLIKDFYGSYKIKDLEEFIKQTFDTIPLLKFNKLKGKFIDKEIDTEVDTDVDIHNEIDIELQLSIFEEIQKLPYIKMEYDECCVCNEITTTRTSCNHILCIECWDKMKKRCSCRDDDCMECNEKACPICREDLYIEY